MIVTKICKSCGEEFSFQGKQGRRVHCSDICRKKYTYRAKYKRICVICGNEFMTKCSTKKTCSDACFHERMSSTVSSRHNEIVVKANKRKRRKRADDNERKNISNKYVKLLLHLTTGVRMKDITDPSLIQLKRQQIRLDREIRKAKEDMKCH